MAIWKMGNTILPKNYIPTSGFIVVISPSTPPMVMTAAWAGSQLPAHAIRQPAGADLPFIRTAFKYGGTAICVGYGEILTLEAEPDPQLMMNPLQGDQFDWFARNMGALRVVSDRGAYERVLIETVHRLKSCLHPMADKWSMWITTVSMGRPWLFPTQPQHGQVWGGGMAAVAAMPMTSRPRRGDRNDPVPQDAFFNYVQPEHTAAAGDYQQPVMTNSRLTLEQFYLAKLGEESGEVGRIVGKCKLFGLNDLCPPGYKEAGKTNLQILRDELIDLIAAWEEMAAVISAGQPNTLSILDGGDIDQALEVRRQNNLKSMALSCKNGILELGYSKRVAIHIGPGDDSNGVVHNGDYVVLFQRYPFEFVIMRYDTTHVVSDKDADITVMWAEGRATELQLLKAHDATMSIPGAMVGMDLTWLRVNAKFLHPTERGDIVVRDDRIRALAIAAAHSFSWEREQAYSGRGVEEPKPVLSAINVDLPQEVVKCSAQQYGMPQKNDYVMLVHPGRADKLRVYQYEPERRQTGNNVSRIQLNAGGAYVVVVHPEGDSPDDPRWSVTFLIGNVAEWLENAACNLFTNDGAVGIYDARPVVQMLQQI